MGCLRLGALTAFVCVGGNLSGNPISVLPPRRQELPLRPRLGRDVGLGPLALAGNPAMLSIHPDRGALGPAALGAANARSHHLRA